MRLHCSNNGRNVSTPCEHRWRIQIPREHRNSFRRLYPEPKFRKSLCRAFMIMATFSSGLCWRTCPATIRTQVVCFRSSEKTRIRHECSPAKADHIRLTDVSSYCPNIPKPNDCQPHLIRSLSTVLTRINAPIYTGKLEIPACRLRHWMT